MEHPGDEGEDEGVDYAQATNDEPHVDGSGEGQHHHGHYRLDYQDHLATVYTVGEHTGHGADGQKWDGAHAGGNAHQKGRAGDLPHQPGDGYLLEPHRRGIAQVAEPKEEEVLCRSDAKVLNRRGRGGRG